MSRVPIPYSSIEALGGRQEGDPPGLEGITEVDGEVVDVYDLPQSGALVKRVLWRHLGGRALGRMEVPDLIRVTDEWDEDYDNGGRCTWAIRVRAGTPIIVGYGHITDECEALAAIVEAEAAKLEPEKPGSIDQQSPGVQAMVDEAATAEELFTQEELEDNDG